MREIYNISEWKRAHLQTSEAKGRLDVLPEGIPQQKSRSRTSLDSSQTSRVLSSFAETDIDTPNAFSPKAVARGKTGRRGNITGRRDHSCTRCCHHATPRRTPPPAALAAPAAAAGGAQGPRAAVFPGVPAGSGVGGRRSQCSVSERRSPAAGPSDENQAKWCRINVIRGGPPPPPTASSTSPFYSS